MLPPLPSSLSTRFLSTINPETGACKHHPAVQLCELVDKKTRWVVKRKICSKCGARAPVGVSRRMPGVSVVNPSSNKHNSSGTAGRRQQPDSRGRSSEQSDGAILQQILAASSSSSRYDASMSKSRASTADMKEKGAGKLDRRAAKEAASLVAKRSSSRGAADKSYHHGHIDMSDRAGYVDKKHSSRSKSTRRTRSLSQPRRKERSSGGDEEEEMMRGGDDRHHRHHGHGRRSLSRNSKEGRSRVTWSTKPESLSSNEEVVAASTQDQLIVIPKKRSSSRSKKERKYHQTNRTENNSVSVYSKPVIHIDRMDRVVHQTQVCM
ncbi:hypothetical protein ACHAWU_001876 [Discostella pseudostelligera]|uniref:Uncharacterized protein n=1 Tax=Discostella pseudostelligera TaxID=259834 RepID=A0ABD3MI94_9STRA